MMVGGEMSDPDDGVRREVSEWCDSYGDGPDEKWWAMGGEVMKWGLSTAGPDGS